MALARKSNEDTIRDLQGQLDCLIGVLSRAASSASGLLHETAQVAGVASEADAALLQFEEQAAKLLAGLSVALPESSAASESRLSSILQEAQDGGASAEEALARVAPEDLAVSCARALEEALHNEMVLDLQEPWSRTAEALRASVETGRALRDFLSRAEGMSRTASFERAISDISFACAHLEDAGLSLVVSEGGSERYELLSGVIEDSLRVLQGLARERQVGLAGDIQRDLPRLRIVRLWISRALQNLVSLALRQERPGGVVHVSARAVGAGVEISLKADVIRVPPGLRTLDEVLSRHRWRMEIPRQAGPAMLLTILAPESSEEDTLRVEVPGYDALEAGTKQALRAAEALGGSPEGAPAAAFLYCKALEIEIAAVLSPGLERHALLPRALSLRNDPQAFSDAAKATSVVLGAAERETLKRAEELVDAVMKNRVRKELADWRSLAMALALFGLPDHVLPTAPDAQFVRALYRAEQSRGTASADRVSLEQTRSLCLAALGGLSGMRQERMGRRPPPRS
jgi:signal transduction histidine kinase